MEVCLGIDLGTTYSCVSFIDAGGEVKVIPNTDGAETTPSVIWFDGKSAFVGKKANDRKIMPTSPVYEFVKRDIGRPRQINTRYDIAGFYYGPMGMSAIILRKIKKDALSYLKKNGYLPVEAEEKTTLLNAVITVPAYFGDLQRQETRKAGFVAGLNVLSIINEPTAAAIAFGRRQDQNKKVMVFDLGGGTFDVTLLHIENGHGTVLASDGADQLGGKDWDELIMDHLYSQFKKITGNDIPDDMGWEIQQKALEAKFELTDQEQTVASISYDGKDVELILYRSTPTSSGETSDFDDFDMDPDRPFYFEERSQNLLSLCKAICLKVLDAVQSGWADIDEIIMAGGSCRMPMIPKMLEEISGHKIRRNIPGFNYDTAISIGAAIHGSRTTVIRDVTSKTIGIELKKENLVYIEPLILKNKLLPATYEQVFNADANAILKIYEGDSPRPDECVLRGRLELGNPSGKVKVSMAIDDNGVLHSIVTLNDQSTKELTIQTDEISGDSDLENLKHRIQAIDIRS